MADSANEEPVLDRNGFVVASADSTHVAKGLTAADIATIRRHEIKWMGMLNDWDTWMLKRPGKIKSRCRKGIPDSLRGRIWARLTGADELMAANPGLFAKLAATEVAPDDPAVPFLEVIDKDLHRTFPDHVMFTKSGFGQGDMRDVLKAYVLLPVLPVTQAWDAEHASGRPSQLSHDDRPASTPTPAPASDHLRPDHLLLLTAPFLLAGTRCTIPLWGTAKEWGSLRDSFSCSFRPSKRFGPWPRCLTR